MFAVRYFGFDRMEATISGCSEHWGLLVGMSSMDVCNNPFGLHVIEPCSHIFLYPAAIRHV